MIHAFKIAVTLFCAFIALFFITTMLSIFTKQPDWLSGLISLPGGVLAAWFVWRSTAGPSAGLGLSVVGGALIIGGLGFIIGFVGPIIFFPEANQGPLLGLFITGPLGTAAGAIGGGVYWYVQKQKKLPAA
ncbi:MAG TPA: multidrug ABC transporter permease [Nitrospiria bacterium]